MIPKRCDKCNLFGCHHVRPRYITGAAYTNSIAAEVPMIKNGREIIPPATGTYIPGTNGTKWIPSTLTNPSRELQKINMQTDWVNCNICKGRVMVRYLDNHLKIHTNTFEPSTSTAIVKSNTTSSSSSTSGTSTYTYKKLDLTSEERSKPTIKTPEHYKFRSLEQACFASSTTHDSRYSDFTIIFWEKEKPSVQSAVYSGAHSSYVTKEWERFLIHIVYDSLEDYYTLTSKLLKRGQHSSWDTEDVNPDRICYQEELQSEIKRALLFSRVSPKAAYKHFRKLCKQPFVISYDDNDKAIVTQTENCSILQERLKKITPWTSEHVHHSSWGEMD
jgi:hypothetical protein